MTNLAESFLSDTTFTIISEKANAFFVLVRLPEPPNETEVNIGDDVDDTLIMFPMMPLRDQNKLSAVDELTQTFLCEQTRHSVT